MENKMENKVEFKKSDVYTRQDFENDVQELFGRVPIVMNFDKDDLEIRLINDRIIVKIRHNVLDFNNIGDELGLKIYRLWKKIGQAR